MKLLTKTSLYVATLSLFLFFLMGIAFYQVLKQMSGNEMKREILEMKESVVLSFPLILDQTIRKLPGIDSLRIVPTGHMIKGSGIFRDTVLFDPKADQYRNFTIYSFSTNEGDAQYLVELYISTTPSDKLVERVTILMTLMVVFFLAGIFFLNRFIFTRLWKDFFLALDKLKSYSADTGPISLQESDIHEFAELNQVLISITTRLSDDYMELKEYTDLTAHELQTPLAIIKSRVELLLQSENLKENEIELISDVYKNTDHLSRLNSTLTLIARIENHQYKNISRVNISELAEHQMVMLQELAELKDIKISTNRTGKDIQADMDDGLANILLVNLLKNAINHNLNGGSIHVESSDQTLILSNSGLEPRASSGKLFESFYKESKDSENLGLGLSLVRKICELYGFNIDHKYDHGLHTFKIIFPASS